MAQKINLQRNSNVNTEYKNYDLRFTIPRWNVYNFCFTTDITVNGETIYGVTLRAGINVVRQFNLPFTLYVINSDDILLDPITFSSIRLYILEEDDLKNLTRRIL